MAAAKRRIQGNTTLAAIGNSNIIAAVASQKFFIQQLVLTISVFAASAVVSVDDGTTTLFAWDAGADTLGQPPMLDFGEEGLEWTAANKAIRLVVAGGNATVHAVAKGYTLGQA